MIGRGSPIPKPPFRARWATVALVVCALASIVHARQAAAAELNVRMRIAWGSGAQSPQKWFGRIAVSDGTLAALQPLGIEADEAAALRLVNNEVVVAPLVTRAFDGCDVTIRADEAAMVLIELRTASAAAKRVEIPLRQLARQELREPLDDLGSYLLVNRSPGDKLRVSIDRAHLVFDPGELWKLVLTPDLADEAADGALELAARLRRIGETEVLWQKTQPYDAAAPPIALELNAPAAEGAYRLEIAATRRQDGLAEKLVPWEQPEVVASRDVEFVVVDPGAKLARLTDQWDVVQTIDPLTTRWWQRLPQWAQLDRLPAFSTPRPLGNLKPTPAASAAPGMAELPATPVGDELAWQAYVLPIRDPGSPHAVEIELPRGQRQHLTVSIIEPDAAGRVTSFGRDWGVYTDEEFGPLVSAPAVDIHRMVFWPRSRSPVLLIANRSHARSVQFGKIRVVRRQMAAAPAAEADPPAQRLVAAYISTPRLAECLGAAEQFDGSSGLSVDGWSTFLESGNRLAQQLRAAGYNAAIVSVAGDGSSLAPIDALGASPRYDAGPLAGSGADPLRKDVLEALLRIFDREGLKLVPAVQLATPLPALESLRTGEDAKKTGVEWVAADGRTWAEHFPGDAAASPRYNLLNVDVQQRLGALADDFVARYGDHPSLGGLALQLPGGGFGVLPGAAWGLDDATTARFAADEKVALPRSDPDRFQQRWAVLNGSQAVQWRQWRTAEVTGLYSDLAARIARRRSDLKLVLCTESLFDGPDVSEKLRQTVNGRGSLDEVLVEMGVDVRSLATTPGVVVLRSRRLGADDSLQSRALDLRVNSAAELDHAFASARTSGELLFHSSARLRLPSFDVQSPFGADRTYLSLSAPSAPAGNLAQRALASAMASRDLSFLGDGSELLPLLDNPGYVRMLRIIQELPVEAADVRTERRQPITLRIYQGAEATTLCLINESPWSVVTSVPIDSGRAVPWRQLGAAADEEGAAGELPAGRQLWTVVLPAYGMVARQYGARDLHVGDFTPQVSEEARAALAARVAAIEGRMQSLDVERRYQELQNPGFEVGANDGPIAGWQPRVGEAGAVAIDAAVAHGGARSLRLESLDAIGVAAQTHLFPIPGTGQLVIRAQVRTANLAAGAKLYAWVEYESGGAMRQRYQAVEDQAALDADWTSVEVAFDELPLASTGQMRVQFHLAGAGEAWVDDVELLDLWFPNSQRVELAKRLYAANAALDDGNLEDCQRLVDGYWARYLIEHVPTTSLAAKPAETAPAPAASEGEGETRFGRRIRGMVPKILR